MPSSFPGDRKVLAKVMEVSVLLYLLTAHKASASQYFHKSMNGSDLIHDYSKL